MKILITDHVSEEFLKEIEKLGEIVVKPGLSEEELCREIEDYEVLIVRSATKVTRKVIEAGKKLKIVARAGVGIDNIDVKAAEEKGVRVIYAPEASKTAVAELVIGLMLCWARKIPQAYKEMKEGKWDREKFIGTELKGKTLGVIGVGRIGGEVALKALAFGMRVLGYDLVRREEMERAGVRYVDLPTLLKEADFVSIHVPLNSQTERMIGEKELSLMKPTAVLINTSRGKIVDERALVKALKERKIAGACLDVFEEEPTKNLELLSLEQVIPTPHLGASTVESQRNIALILSQKLKELMEVERG
ncbi:MAG: hydroxyacid dehydrogenase [Candidatus Hadarchaeales archaeon]